jgi:hypothetical protein
MAEGSWTSILPALALMLTKAGDEPIVESILRAYQLFIHICGSNELIAPRCALTAISLSPVAQSQLCLSVCSHACGGTIQGCVPYVAVPFCDPLVIHHDHRGGWW